MLGLASKLGGSRMPRAQPSKRLPLPEGCLLAPPDAPPLRTQRMQLAMHDEPRVTPRRVCRVLENITMKPNATDGSSPVHVHSKGRGLVGDDNTNICALVGCNNSFIRWQLDSRILRNSDLVVAPDEAIVGNSDWPRLSRLERMQGVSYGRYRF